MRPLYRQFFLIGTLSAIGIQSINGQHKVDPRLSYHRVICVVPMIGSGSHDDPRRPMYATSQQSTDRSGILAWNAIETDDGKHAIVEFVAIDRNSLQNILSDKSIICFERGRAGAGKIAAELKKWRSDIRLDTFRAVAP